MIVETVRIEEKMLSLLHKHPECCWIFVYQDVMNEAKLQGGIKCTIIVLIAVCVKCKL